MKHFRDIVEAELAAIVEHHSEMARLERECAKLRQRGLRAREISDDEESDYDQ